MSIEILRRSQLCCGLSIGQLHQVVESVRRVSIRGGQVIFRQDEAGDSLFVVASGRVMIGVSQGNGQERLVDYLGVGDHFGEMAMLTGGRRDVTVTAVIDSDLLELKHDAFQQLLLTVPGLAANVCRTLSYRLRRETNARRRRPKPQIVGLVCSTSRTEELLPRVAAALASQGVAVRVLADRKQKPTRDLSYAVEQIPPQFDRSERAAWIQKRLTQVTAQQGHILVNVSADAGGADPVATLLRCEQIWWLVEPGSSAAPFDALRAMLAMQPTLASRIHPVWVLSEGEGPIPLMPPDLRVAEPDFKIILSDDPDRPSRHERPGISRLARHFHGTRIGLALGGGGARGLAHLGVLRALEREGIDFDLVSGTSVGALTALPYAAGWNLDDAIAAFKSDLTPELFFQHIPRGCHWFMVCKFRMGGWEPMLRRRFGDVRFEQLRIPLSTVAADLISGRQVVRDRGDVVNAVLESINLPAIARPILRDGMALVDGGILNNVPAAILPERGADLVIGIDVAAKLAHRFAGNTPATQFHQMRRPGVLETILRANEVQDHQINTLQTSGVDLLISVDTSAFEFADFTKATELAEAGERAAEQALPKLKQLLAEQKNSESVTSARFVCNERRSTVGGFANSHEPTQRGPIPRRAV